MDEQGTAAPTAISRRGLLAGTAAAAALAAWPRGAAAAASQLIFTQGSNPPSLDAMTTSSQASRNINMNIYETLYGFDEHQKPMPILAEGVEISKDGLTYRFTLRKGVKFHNLQEMKAADVVASLERYRKVGATANLLEPVNTIAANGDYEVVVTMHRDTPTFLESFCSPRAPAVIIPASDGAAAPNKTSLVGTGPYKYVEYVPDSHVKLAKFAEYSQDTRYAGMDGFGGRKTAYLDTVVFRIMPELGAEIAALETNEVQAVEIVPAPSAKRLASNKDITLYRYPDWAMLTLVMNVNDGPAANPKFREAVQVALNMEAIMALATSGFFSLDPDWQYKGTPYYGGDIGKNLYNRHDIPRAKKLLAEAGYKGEKFTILTDSNYTEHNKSAVVIAANLKEAGINAVIDQVDWPTAVKTGLQQATGWGCWTLMLGIEPYVGPVALTAVLTGKRPLFVKPDPELDALYQKLISGHTVAERKATFDAIQKRLYAFNGIIKLGNTGLIQATRATVEGFKPFRFPRLYDVKMKA